MDRLFLRVYLNLLAALLLGVVLVRVFVIPRVEERVGLNIEETFSPAVAAMAEMLAEDRAERRDVRATLARASVRFRAPIEMIPRAEVPLAPSERSRLDRGEVVRTAEPFRSIVFALVGGTDMVLKIGPINSVHPYGGLRGAAMFALFVGALSLGVYTLLVPIRRRLAALGRAAAALGHGELGARAEVGSADAIGTVASAFNGMADEIQRLVARQEELLHMTSHELRTPLQRLHFGLERLRDAGAEDAERAFDRMDRDLAEMDELIEELLTYVRLKDRRPDLRATVDVTEICADLCERLADTAPRVTIAAPGAGGIEIRGEARLLRRAVSNLVVNALRHARTRVEVEAQHDAGAVRIHVDDDGPGIDAADRERVFEPFVRLARDETGARSGFGLGLAIVRRIAEIHGGSVAVATSPLGGARLQLSLPERAGGETSVDPPS